MSYTYLTNLNFFNDYKGLVEYFDDDITSCLWPNYSPYFYFWNPQLPNFLLNKIYSIKIGSNINNKYKFTPFDHWQNSRFLVRACTNDPIIDGSWNVPSWINVNQTDSTIIIVPENVQSVGFFNLWVQAQLIVGLIDSSKLENYISTNSTSFELINSNWHINTSFSNSYIIIGQTKTFDINFVDEENDKINLKVTDPGGIGVFIKSMSTLSSMIYLNCDDSSLNQTQIKLSYTDRYHMNDSNWQILSFKVNIFVSEPPIFTENIETIYFSRWSSTLISRKLPSIYDPDSSSFSISLLNNSLNFIYITSINENGETVYFINIDCSYKDSWYSAGEFLNLTLILSDDSRAFTEYQVYINLSYNSVIKFDHINDVNINLSQSANFSLNIGNAKFKVKEWETNEDINWIWYSQMNQFMYIFDPEKWDFYYGKTETYNIFRCMKLK